MTRTAGCEDSLIPHGGLQRDLSDPRDLERHNEEVRLLYVGMTRAKQQLYLMHARERAALGGMRRFGARISPFLRSIPGSVPCRSNGTGLSSHRQQYPASRAVLNHKQIHAAQDLNQQQPSPMQMMSASRGELPSVSAPTTPAQRRAARRQR